MFQLGQFDNLKITKRPIVNGKTHKRAYLMKTTDTCSTWIDMQRIEFMVVHHLEDM